MVVTFVVGEVDSETVGGIRRDAAGRLTDCVRRLHGLRLIPPVAAATGADRSHRRTQAQNSSPLSGLIAGNSELLAAAWISTTRSRGGSPWPMARQLPVGSCENVGMSNTFRVLAKSVKPRMAQERAEKAFGEVDVGV
jgi:hypothetical protein